MKAKMKVKVSLNVQESLFRHALIVYGEGPEMKEARHPAFDMTTTLLSSIGDGDLSDVYSFRKLLLPALQMATGYRLDADASAYAACVGEGLYNKIGDSTFLQDMSFPQDVIWVECNARALNDARAYWRTGSVKGVPKMMVKRLGLLLDNRDPESLSCFHFETFFSPHAKTTILSEPLFLHVFEKDEGGRIRPETHTAHPVGFTHRLVGEESLGRKLSPKTQHGNIENFMSLMVMSYSLFSTLSQQTAALQLKETDPFKKQERRNAQKLKAGYIEAVNKQHFEVSATKDAYAYLESLHRDIRKH